MWCRCCTTPMLLGFSAKEWRSLILTKLLGPISSMSPLVHYWLGDYKCPAIPGLNVFLTTTVAFQAVSGIYIFAIGGLGPLESGQSECSKARYRMANVFSVFGLYAISIWGIFLAAGRATTAAAANIGKNGNVEDLISSEADTCDFDFYLCGYLNAAIPFVLITVLILLVASVYGMTGTTDLEVAADCSRWRSNPLWSRVHGRDFEPADTTFSDRAERKVAL